MLLLRARRVKKSLPREQRNDEWKSAVPGIEIGADHHPLWSRKSSREIVSKDLSVPRVNVTSTKFCWGGWGILKRAKDFVSYPFSLSINSLCRNGRRLQRVGGGGHDIVLAFIECKMYFLFAAEWKVGYSTFFPMLIFQLHLRACRSINRREWRDRMMRFTFSFERTLKFN